MNRPLRMRRAAARRHRVWRRVGPALGLAACTVGAFGAVWAAGAAGTVGAATDPTYAALRAARPDGRVAAVHGLVLDRDVFHFELESGTVHFLEPVAGRTIGAVFLGRGTLRLSPASAAERRQLALELGEGKDFEVLTDSFDELVLLFGDDTAQEIALAAPIEKHAPDPRARQLYERWLERQRRDFRLNLQLRLLRDLLDVPAPAPGAGGTGVFLALLAGKKLPPSLVALDPDGAGSLVRGLRLGHEPALLWVEDPHRGGAWYLSDRRAALQSRAGLPHAPVEPPARALHYWVATTVPRDTDLAGVTTIRIAVTVPDLRVLPIQLMPRLRIDEAVYGPGPRGAPADAAALPPPPAGPAAPAPPGARAARGAGGGAGPRARAEVEPGGGGDPGGRQGGRRGCGRGLPGGAGQGLGGAAAHRLPRRRGARGRRRQELRRPGARELVPQPRRVRRARAFRPCVP